MASLLRLALFLSCVVVTVSLKRATMEMLTLVTDFDGNIYSYSLNDSSIRKIPISDRGQGPEAIDFDPVNSLMYWTNIRADTIKRTRLDGSNEEIIVRATETPRGICVDYINNILFYTEEKIDIIGKVYLGNMTQRTVLSTGMDRPLAITLDMEKQIFYWSDIGSFPKIEQANYDGSGRKTIVSRDMKWPIALALDETKEKLFWCDGNKKKIQYINLVTNKITVVLNEMSTHYYDLNYVDGTIFFIDLLQRNMFKSVSAAGGSVSTYRFGKTMSKWRKIRVIKVHVCDDMTWGVNCSRNCGNCLNNAVCNKFSGQCPSGCQTGYDGQTCESVCSNGTFGEGCNSICGHCHESNTCDHVTGLCQYGCAAGWDGTYCTEECSHGTHGRKCSAICGHCLDGQPCEKESGNCSNGCEPGWMGSTCKDECSDGTFGVNCQYQCQCHDGSVCDTLTGECPREIIPVRSCPDDRYGLNCSQACGHCLYGMPCNETSGECPEDCEPGWQGQTCQTGCPANKYGIGCYQVCRCKSTQTCDVISGRCYDQGSRSDRQIGNAHYIDTPLTSGLCVTIVILVVLLAIALIFIYRRKRLDRQSSSSRESLATEKSFSVSFNTSEDRLIN